MVRVEVKICGSEQDKIESGRIIKLQSKKLEFPRLFTSKQENSKIYEEICDPILLDLSEGSNCSLILFGESSRDRNFSLFGNTTKNGFIYYFLEDVFTRKIPNLKIGIIQFIDNQIFDFLKKRPVININSMTLSDIENESRAKEIINLIHSSYSQNSSSLIRIYRDGSTPSFIDFLNCDDFSNSNEALALHYETLITQTDSTVFCHYNGTNFNDLDFAYQLSKHEIEPSDINFLTSSFDISMSSQSYEGRKKFYSASVSCVDDSDIDTDMQRLCQPILGQNKSMTRKLFNESVDVDQLENEIESNKKKIQELKDQIYRKEQQIDQSQKTLEVGIERLAEINNEKDKLEGQIQSTRALNECLNATIAHANQRKDCSTFETQTDISLLNRDEQKHKELSVCSNQEISVPSRKSYHLEYYAIGLIVLLASVIVFFIVNE